MLELWEAEGAFERIEAWLRERGFFAPGGEGLVADLYLGYGLSRTIRRTTSRLPPGRRKRTRARAPASRGLVVRIATPPRLRLSVSAAAIVFPNR